MSQRQSKSLVVFLSSFLDSIPSPYNANYGASKAFIKSFGESIGLENMNINVSVLKPLYVKTRLSSFVSGKNWLLASPEECVASSIKDIEKGYLISHGYWKHKIAALFILNNIMKRWMIEWVAKNNKKAEERVKKYKLLKKHSNKP